MNRLDQLGKALGKAGKETQFNTRRIAANLPLIERKLDNIAGDTNYKLEFPITEKDHSVIMTLQVKPDNCCDCIPGAEPAQRYATGYPDYFWNDILEIIHHPSGHPELDYYPEHYWENGVDYPAHYHDPLDTQGTITNIWFAWEGYPFFYPTVSNPFGYGHFNPSAAPTGGLTIPTNGVYTMIFRNAAAGRSTPDSQVVAAIKRLPANKENIDENWETISRKIYRPPFDGLTIAVYAYCFPLNEGDIVGGWLKASNVDAWHPGEGNTEGNLTMIDLIGLGFGALMGKVYTHDGTPIEGATVSYTQTSGLGERSGSTTTNDEGIYYFYDVPPAMFYVTVTKSNYYTQTQTIEVLFNQLLELNFEIVHV